MGLFEKIASLGIGEIARGIGGLAVDLRTAITGDLPPEKKAQVDQMLINLHVIEEQLIGAEKELQSSVVIAEIKGQSWLQRNWRPLLMAMFGVIIANNYILFPYIQLLFGPEYTVQLAIPPDMWGLLKLGVSGYIVGRSAEKIAEGSGVKGMLKKITGGNGDS